MLPVRPGPTNSLTDVAGLRVGHATRRGKGRLTGTTVVRAPDEGAVAGVDVRGGGPGTRETDLLDPRNVVERVHAVCLTGGSALGLAAADGVAAGLLGEGVGVAMGGPGQVVPIVPAAVVFDLGRGGDWAGHPQAADGRAALDAATTTVEQGSVGAGTGARAGGLKGGVGSASAVLEDGTTVAALVVCNSLGAPWDWATGELLAARRALGGELAVGPLPPSALGGLRVATERQRALLRPGSATTIGVIATDATLTKAQCQKTAGIGHDGLARAIAPVHTMMDGDTLFALATGARPAPDLLGLMDLMAVAADVVTRAVGHAVLAAEGTDSAEGRLASWRELATA
ncbi:MAG: P1 family peptidase [Micrococcales bacterium]|nr:P1 family peptidase [Micrococcales bacterium]